MKISDLLVTDVMILDLKATTKQAAFEEMIDRLYDAGRITDKQAFMQGILAREAQTTTGLGDGIAMPHSKNSAVKLPTVVFARSEKRGRIRRHGRSTGAFVIYDCRPCGCQ